MKDLFSGFSEERNSMGQTVVDFRAPIGIPVVAAVTGPLVIVTATYFVTRDWPMGTPWWIYAAIIGAGCMSVAFLFWFGSGSQVRVSVDRQKSCLVIATRSGQSELPMRDVAKAVIDSQSGTEGSTGYRLAFLLRNGERVPATSWYFNFYREGDRKSVLEAINRELNARAGMV